MNAHRHVPNLIAVASGKGGVGKTWLSATLAHAIARSGRRVLLFDGDIGLANVDVQLGLSPTKDLSSVMQGRSTLPEVVMEYAEGGFDVIAGRSGSAGLAGLGMEKLQVLMKDLAALAPKYDVVLLDLGAGVETHVRTLAGFASRCIVVVTDEPTSLTDAYAFIKLLHADGAGADFSIIINQASTQKEGEQTFQTLSKAAQNFLQLGLKMLGVVRRDTKVKESIRRQKPLLAIAPQCTAATDVAAIAVKLMKK